MGGGGLDSHSASQGNLAGGDGDLIKQTEGDKMKLLQLTIETANKREVVIHDDETREQVEARANRAMSRGATITWQDGREEWMDKAPLFKAGVDNSITLLWHQDGNRIRVEILKATKVNGEITREVLRTVWMDYLKAMD
jgi:hypothetical protein